MALRAVCLILQRGHSSPLQSSKSGLGSHKPMRINGNKKPQKKSSQKKVMRTLNYVKKDPNKKQGRKLDSALTPMTFPEIALCKNKKGHSPLLPSFLICCVPRGPHLCRTALRSQGQGRASWHPSPRGWMGGACRRRNPCEPEIEPPGPKGVATGTRVHHATPGATNVLKRGDYLWCFVGSPE